MPYRFATLDLDFTDYASGRVIYNLPGAPAFPVRLASEMFLRALDILKPAGPIRIYDPVCGAAYHLTVLGFLHGGQIQSITASEIDEQAVTAATRNLGLLSQAGLDRREAELRRMLAEYTKESHAEALASLEVLREKLGDAGHAIQTQVFQANALEPTDERRPPNGTVDLVISDVPYGKLTNWQQAGAGSEPPIWRMLENLLPLLTPGGVVAIAADKGQKYPHPGYRRVDRFQIGHRQVVLLKPQGTLL